MQDSKFWRVVAVLMITALLYVGHGLHNSGLGLPSLINTAHAGGVGVHNGLIYTTNAAGDKLSQWVVDPSNAKMHYLHTVGTESGASSASKK